MANSILMTRSRILVPIDFRPHSDAALHYAGKIAAKSKDMISCLYVMEDYEILTDNLANNQIKRKMRLEAEYKLSERVHSILKSEDSTAFELIITSGKAHQKILEKASDLHAKLIVMGKSNSLDVINRKVGSNTKYVIAHAQIPVIVMSENRIAEKDYVIVSLDISQPEDILVKCAIDTARLLHAGVVLISVIEKEKASFEPVYRAMLKEIRQILSAFNIKCNSHLLVAQSSVPQEILAYSNRIDSAVILLITRMENDKSSSNIDSSALEVISNSRMPVQCINPGYTSNLLIDELRNRIDPLPFHFNFNGSSVE